MWRAKAHRRIAELSRAAYLAANTRKDGKRYARHVPYTIPAEAEALIECLGTDDEARAKSIFVHGFAGRFSDLYRV